MLLRAEYRRLLLDRSFRYFMTSCIFGTLASGLAYILVIWMVIANHASISQTLFMMLCFWIPRLLFGAQIGVWVDRLDRRKLMILAETVRAVKFLIFGIVICWQNNLYLLYILMFLAGCFGALYLPLLPAFVYDLVEKPQLLHANTLINSFFEMGNILGRGVLAVAVIYMLTPPQGLFVVALLYVFSAWTIVPVYLKQKKRAKKEVQRSVLIDIGIVIKVLQESSQLRMWCIIQALATFSIMCAPVLVGPYVKNSMHMGSNMFALTEAILALSTICGAFFWTFLMKNLIHSKYVTMIALSLVFISYVIIGYNPGLFVVECGFALLGFSWGCWSLIISHVQQLTPPHCQGRIQAVTGIFMTVLFILFECLLLIWVPQYNAAEAFLLLACVAVATLLCLVFSSENKKSCVDWEWSH